MDKSDWIFRLIDIGVSLTVIVITVCLVVGAFDKSSEEPIVIEYRSDGSDYHDSSASTAIPTDNYGEVSAEIVESEEELIQTPAYNIPLDNDLQLYIINLCEEHGIDPTVVLGIIERESKFNSDAVGDDGKSFGLMQIQTRWHEDRMKRLGVTDLLNPYQNVLVGVDLLSELVEFYDGNVERALMAYNAGISGANKHWFSKGIYSNAYSQGVLEYSINLKEGV